MSYGKTKFCKIKSCWAAYFIKSLIFSRLMDNFSAKLDFLKPVCEGVGFYIRYCLDFTLFMAPMIIYYYAY